MPPVGNAPDAVLLLTSTCPNCPAVLESLAQLVKRGLIGKLEIINLEQHPEASQHYGGIRSVPWLQIGDLEFQGVHTLAELEHWARIADSDKGIREYLIEYLKEGQLPLIESKLRSHPSWFTQLLDIIPDMDAPMQARIGVGAVFESFSGESLLEPVIEPLIALSQHADHRVRGDACYYLGLTRFPAVRTAVTKCLADENPEVREIAQEALDSLPIPH